MTTFWIIYLIGCVIGYLCFEWMLIGDEKEVTLGDLCYGLPILGFSWLVALPLLLAQLSDKIFTDERMSKVIYRKK